MIKVFLSYSHKDVALQKELDEHLGALRHEGIIDTWWDSQIPIGNIWSEDIARQLEAADLILLLVSSAFLASTYCYVKEMRRAVERYDAGEARVVPILLRPCLWELAPFAKIQGLPKGMVPVTTTPPDRRDEIWTEVVKGIHQAATICNAHKSNVAGENRDYPAIALRGILSVDPEQLYGIIEDFKKGDKVRIRWPKSSDELISLIQEAVKRIGEENARSFDLVHFLKTGPAAIRDTLHYRAKCERRLPELMSIMSDFGEFKDLPGREEFYSDCRFDAIKFYLLRANFLAHSKLVNLSYSGALWDRDLHAPDAWVPYQEMPSDKFYSQLYNVDESQSLVRTRLEEIGEYKIMRPDGSPGWIDMHIPGHALDPFGNFIIDEKIICRWTIPQVELSEQPGGSLPDSHNGRWKGYLA
jgi:hypothetical protein